jgi:hypothetical protein
VVFLWSCAKLRVQYRELGGTVDQQYQYRLIHDLTVLDFDIDQIRQSSLIV